MSINIEDIKEGEKFIAICDKNTRINISYFSTIKKGSILRVRKTQTGSFIVCGSNIDINELSNLRIITEEEYSKYNILSVGDVVSPKKQYTKIDANEEVVITSITQSIVDAHSDGYYVGQFTDNICVEKQNGTKIENLSASNFRLISNKKFTPKGPAFVMEIMGLDDDGIPMLTNAVIEYFPDQISAKHYCKNEINKAKRKNQEVMFAMFPFEKFALSAPVEIEFGDE